MTTRFAIAVIVVAALLWPPAAGAQADRPLVYAQNVPVTAMDTAGATIGTVYPAGYEAMFLIYDNLVAFNDKMELVPQLATEWSVSQDGRTWTFRLRRNVTFHDGTPFGADAAIFHLQRQIDPQTNRANRPLWDPLGGAGTVRKIDDFTIAITTERPYGPLLNTLAHGSGGIVSPTAVRRLGEGFARAPVGTGPYAFERLETGTELVLRRNDNYWGGRPAYSRIVMRHVPDPTTRIALLQSGQVDVINLVPPENVAQLQGNPAIDVISRPALRTFGFAFNLNRRQFQDVRVRQAFNYAVNRGPVIKAIFKDFATPIDSPISPNAVGYVPVGTYPYDVDRAKALLTEAGWRPGPDGVLRRDGQAFEITLLTPIGLLPKDIEVTQAFQNFLRVIGVRATINRVEPAAFWDFLRVPPDRLQWDMVLFGFNPSNGDGGYHLTSLFESNPSRTGPPKVWNFTWYSNLRVDQLLGQADATVDAARRRQLLGEVARIVWHDAPYVWLYAENVIVAKRKEVKNVEVLPVIFTILRNARP
jgi:ABC-type transport system substrate-binding protein